MVYKAKELLELLDGIVERAITSPADVKKMMKFIKDSGGKVLWKGKEYSAQGLSGTAKLLKAVGPGGDTVDIPVADIKSYERDPKKGVVVLK